LDVRANACNNNNSEEAERTRSVLETKRRHESDLQTNSVRLFKSTTTERRGIVPQRSEKQDGGRCCCDPQTNSVRLFKSTTTERRGKVLLLQTKRKHDEGEDVNPRTN